MKGGRDKRWVLEHETLAFAGRQRGSAFAAYASGLIGMSRAIEAVRSKSLVSSTLAARITDVADEGR